MGKPCRRTNTPLIFEKENKDTPEIAVENFSELLKNGDEPKKYIKEIGIPLEEVGKRLKDCIETFGRNGFLIGADYGLHLNFVKGKDKIVESATIKVFFLKEEKELGGKKC